jgi:hypothetical protein
MGVFSGLFKGAENQRGSGGGLYFPCKHNGQDIIGKYVAKIVKVATFSTLKNAVGFAVEFEVLETNWPTLIPVGCRPSYMSQNDKVPDIKLWQANVADFMRAGYACWAIQRQGAPGPGQPGYTPPDAVPLDPEGNMIRAAHDEVRLKDQQGNPLPDNFVQKGCLGDLVIAIDTFNKPTRAGGPFTMHHWSVPGDRSHEKAA